MDGSETEGILGIVKTEMPQYSSESPLDDDSNSLQNKQNSIISLTINECESKSEKSLGSMNMDDLMNDFLNSEGNSSPNPNELTNEGNIEGQLLAIPRQNSLLNPAFHCNKTLEDVWDGIMKSEANKEIANVDNNVKGQREYRKTFGEMTLQDFLVKVGVIEAGSGLSLEKAIEAYYKNNCESFSNKQSCLDPCNGQRPTTVLEFMPPKSENNENEPLMYPIFTHSGDLVGEGSSSIRNGKYNGFVQLAVERRQRRMIKNRESAARSRARKQAYTAELEIELARLREENTKLKLILADSESKRKHQEVVKANSSANAAKREDKLKTVRRTLSF